MKTPTTLRLAAALGLALALGGCRGAPAPVEATPEALFTAARTGDTRAVRRLLEAGVPVDSTDRYGATALLMAARAGQAAAVRTLLAHEADPDRRESFYGSTPLGMALFGGHPEVAVILLEAGADDREAALEAAVRGGDLDLARAAVAAGPLYASHLEALRAGAEDLDEPLRQVLASARTRPDPEPPALTPEDLARYTGRFEGWASGLQVDVTVEGGRLHLALDGAGPEPMTVVGEDRFRSEDGTLEASFYGRAGTIEGIGLRHGETRDNLRHSVAEPVGPAGYRPAEDEPAKRAPTVHWPSFRGTNAAGIGDGADPPIAWDLETGEGVLWSADLPGLGNSSPVVWGDRVFITTAVARGIPQEIRTGLTGSGEAVDEQVRHSWRVLAFHKRTGELLWDTEVGSGVPLTRRHFKATQANSTPATDGRHVAVVFPTAGLAVLDLDGNIRWRHELGGLNAGAFTDAGVEWGFASSPILHDGNVILQADTHDGPYLAAWDAASGQEIWRVERDVAPGWATPSVLPGPEGDELVVNASTIHAYDPSTGRELWSLGPNSELVIATPVVGDGVVFVSAGYPPVKPVYAVRAGTRGALQVDPAAGDDRLAWSHGRGGAYMPTPLHYRGLFYIVHHNGRLVTYDAGSGAAIYKSRFSQGGVFTGSPVAANGKLYLPTEDGLLYILEAGPEYRELAVHDLGEPLMATPALSEGILLVRTPSRLLALGRPAAGTARR